jgi:hypothetical protein
MYFQHQRLLRSIYSPYLGLPSTLMVAPIPKYEPYVVVCLTLYVTYNMYTFHIFSTHWLLSTPSVGPILPYLFLTYYFDILLWLLWNIILVFFPPNNLFCKCILLQDELCGIFVWCIKSFYSSSHDITYMILIISDTIVSPLYFDIFYPFLKFKF